MLALVTTVTVCAGEARAVETYVGADGREHVVPGTEDPTLPLRLGAAPSPRQPPKHALGLTKKPSAISARQAAGKPTIAARQKVDPRITGAIGDPPKPDAAPDPNDPNVKPRPVKPARTVVNRNPPPPVVIDPGNALLPVDPATDMGQKTHESEDDIMDTAGGALTPGALPTDPVDPTTQYQTQPAAATRAQVSPGTGTRAGGTAQTNSQTPPATIPDPNNPLATIPAPVTSLRPRQVVPIVAPIQPVQPLGAGGTTSSIAQAPQPATTPNPRSTLDDPLIDTQATRYDQAGIQVNSFVWRPAIELSAGTATNIQGSSTGQASSAFRIAPEIIGQSDWSRHQLGIDIHGSFTEFPADWALFRPTVSATVNGRIDFSDDTKLALKTSYGLDKLPASSATAAAGTTGAGLQQTKASSATLTRDIGRFAVSLRGEVDRTDYQLSPPQAVGTTSAGLDNTYAIAALRGTYNLSAGVKPFVELQADARRYDAATEDTTTLQYISHNSVGSALKSGVTLDFGPILAGEASVGFGHETPQSGQLQTLQAVTYDENLVWSPTRLTKVTFSTVSAIEPSLYAGASGAVSRTFGIKVSDDVLRNLTVDVGGSYLARHYTGIYRAEYLDEVTSNLTWKINPMMQAFVRVTYDNFTSSAKTDNYTSATIYAGMRLQK